MEKSIENIWKEGFLKNDALVAPKINDLYNRKSQSIIDKTVRLMKINVIGVFVFGVGFFGYSFVSDVHIFPAFLVFLLFSAVSIYSRIQMNKIKDINKNLSSYEYVKSFHQFLKNQISRNIKLSRFFYPACMLIALMIIWYSKGREVLSNKLLEKFPDMISVGGVPLYLILVVMTLLIIVALFSAKIYKFDIGLVYGRIFKKLEEILADMEELRR